jgi:tetratricopeptide (TPR) repeat protein
MDLGSAICIGKICASAASILGAAHSDAPRDHLKDIFEAIKSGGEAAAKLRGPEVPKLRHALDASEKVLVQVYAESLKNSHSDGFADIVDQAFANLAEVFDSCMPVGQELARLRHDPEAIANHVADAAVARRMEVFRDGEGRKILIVLVMLAYTELDEKPEFMAALARVNWKETFEELERLKADIASVKADTAQIAVVKADTAKILQEQAENERRHRELMAVQEKILSTVAREKGVDPEHLRPVLERLGHTGIPLADIPRVLGDAVDALMSRGETRTVIHNDGAAIDQAIQSARAKLAQIDVAGALATIDAALDEDDSYQESLEAEAEMRRHRVAMGRARARGFFEKAFIQRTIFDHRGAIASLEGGLDLDPERVGRWIELGDERRVIGEGANARLAYESALEAAVRSDDERDLLVSQSKIGDVQVEQGERGSALASYRAGLVIAERLAQTDPGNTDWQRDLSVSHERIGDVQVAQGERAAALASYRTGLAIRERLVQTDPSNTDWQRDLSISHDRIGDVQLAQGERAAALASYSAGLVIAERLAQTDPGNTDWQRDLSISYNKIGDIQVAQGERAAALASYRTGLAIRERLAQTDPGNTDWQRDLSVSHERIGDVQVAQGERAAALASYRTGLAIRERLVQTDPSNTDWQRDLSISHNKIGDVQLAQGERGSALASYRAGLVIAERLAQTDPGNTGWQRDLSISHDRIGDIQVAQGERAAALASYRTGLAIRERLAQTDPSNTDWQRDLSVSHDRIGDIQVAQDERAAALASYRTGLAIRERLAQTDPGNTHWQRDLIVSCVNLSEVDPPRAKRNLLRAKTIAEHMQREGRLAPRDQWILDDLKGRLAMLSG